MSGSTFGKLFKVTTWGESHGEALGVVVDGCPSGLAIDIPFIQNELARRRNSENALSTSRTEADNLQVLSGIFEGKTTGTPISMIVQNTDARSHDYEKYRDIFRPSHADLGYEVKYGIRDYRGGGRASGRETVSRVAAGAIAKQFLSELGITISSKILEIGELVENDSAGGIAECVATGLKIGIGEPVFGKLDAVLAQAIFSVGGVKAISFGEGFNAHHLSGYEFNDFLYYDDKSDEIKKMSNNSGGVTGGLSDGGELNVKVIFKPTPTIKKVQPTINKNRENVQVSFDGRHDKCIATRAIVVVEAMMAITLADLILQNSVCKLDNIKKIYGR